MRLEVELQYAEFHPDQVEKIGKADLTQALKVIHSFPWDREFEKIEERAKQDLTSTVPSVSIKNDNKEILIVSARTKSNFIIELLTSSHRGEHFISTNSLDNNYTLSVDDIVSKFYQGTIKNFIKLKPLTTHVTNAANTYKLKEYPLFLSGFTVGILALILSFDIWSNGFTSKALPAVYFVAFIVFMMGFSAIVTVQYLINDWGKEVSFGPEEIIIRQRGKEIRINKMEIAQIVIVENESHRSLSYYKYARIRTNDSKVYVVTSFIIEPIDLVNRLRINHKMESVFLPIITHDIQSEREKEKIKRNKEKKKIEFLEYFKDYEDLKLKQIISDKANYADYAVEAATEILEKRKRI